MSAAPRSPPSPTWITPPGFRPSIGKPTPATTGYFPYLRIGLAVRCSSTPVSTYGGSRLSVRRRTPTDNRRSEEHTSELQSRPHLVCRLLLEKKKKKNGQTSN